MTHKKYACVFPGQGSQHVGMAEEFMATPATKTLFEEADETLNFHLTKLMKEGDETALTQTENTQPALYVASAAVVQYFTHQTGAGLVKNFAYAAGHSVGEYAAHFAAGTFSFAEGLKLVRARGLAMANAVPSGQGGMAAILGLETDVIKQICLENGAYVANDNAEGQIVISGPIAAVESAATAAKSQGARRTVMLNVSAPFHCPLVEKAGQEMQEYVQHSPMQMPQIPVVINTTAQPATGVAQIKEELPKQITHPVRWRESMQFLAENGVETVVEMGVGKVLTGLAKRCDKRLNGVALNNPRAIDEFLESVE